jgi:hypothetical protein
MVGAAAYLATVRGEDLVVPWQDQEEMVEVLDAHLFNTKIIEDEAKLNWPSFVFA